MSIIVRFPDGQLITYWKATRLQYSSEKGWVLDDDESGWIATIIPMPGVIISGDWDTREEPPMEADYQRLSPTERQLQAEIVRLQKIIDENNLKDFKEEKKKARETKKKEAA